MSGIVRVESNLNTNSRCVEKMMSDYSIMYPATLRYLSDYLQYRFRYKGIVACHLRLRHAFSILFSAESVCYVALARSAFQGVMFKADDRLNDSENIVVSIVLS